MAAKLCLGPYCEQCGDCVVCYADADCIMGGVVQDGGHVRPKGKAMKVCECCGQPDGACQACGRAHVPRTANGCETCDDDAMRDVAQAAMAWEYHPSSRLKPDRCKASAAKARKP